jgi:hypothetical protein
LFCLLHVASASLSLASGTLPVEETFPVLKNSNTSPVLPLPEHLIVGTLCPLKTGSGQRASRRRFAAAGFSSWSKHSASHPIHLASQIAAMEREARTRSEVAFLVVLCSSGCPWSFCSCVLDLERSHCVVSVNFFFFCELVSVNFVCVCMLQNWWVLFLKKKTGGS